MKARSIKLKEAHKNTNNGGVPSFSSILYDLEAQHLITSSSSDPSISIHNLNQPSDNNPKILSHHKDGVTALAISPDSTSLASGSIDHSVKLYKFPGGVFETNVTRFTLPIRTLAFNKSGSMLGAAGDDEGIKLINTIDGSIAGVLRGHKGSVTCLAFDPNGEYLASVDSHGTAIFWQLSGSSILHTLEGVAPKLESKFMSVLNVLSWSPDGNYLAVPGLKGDVVIYDRDTAEKLFSIKGQHMEPVCYVCWSPNGKYIATSGLDKQVLIWNFDEREDIDRQKFDYQISCMAWKPNGNALAVIDVMGRYGVWESPVPSSMKSPMDGAPSLKSKSNGLILFDDDEDDDQELDNTGNMSDSDEDSYGESEPSSRKRLRKQSDYEKMLDEDSDDQLGLLKVERHKKTPRRNKEIIDDAKEKLQHVVKPEKSKMQEAFQPGSTPGQPGKRHFLCYNMLGSITRIENDGSSHIEVDFHDTGRGPRVPSMTDYYGFTMASLNESGSVFANPRKGEKNMSTIMYRPFSSWENNSEWSMRFEEEEVKAVALGTGWVAAVTSCNLLRIFTEGGLQRHGLSLDGPVLTAAGLKDELAVVTHASVFPSDDQILEFKVFNISNGTQPRGGRLPLTPGSRLSWFGFSEEGQLSSYDSKGTLRVFTHQFGGSWIPVFSASKEKKSDESYWMVGLNASKVFVIVCESPDIYPLVTPKPTLTLLSISFPVASSDLGTATENLENDFILNTLYLSQVQKKIEDLASSGHDTSSLKDEESQLKISYDKCITRLISACCHADKLVRATELVRLLSSTKSVQVAIKLVTAMKMPVLAERFSAVLQERLLNESKKASSLSSIPDKSEEHPREVPEASSTPNFLSPRVPKQEEYVKDPPLKPTKSQVSVKAHANERPSNAFVKAPTNEKTSNPIVKTPLNPFRKTQPTSENLSDPIVKTHLKTQPTSEKPSKFDSMKKTKASN
ncbi:hypothetical protein ACHQM5_008782 [Ranunculus cassubicifolius]